MPETYYFKVIRKELGAALDCATDLSKKTADNLLEFGKKNNAGALHGRLKLDAFEFHGFKNKPKDGWKKCGDVFYPSDAKTKSGTDARAEMKSLFCELEKKHREEINTHLSGNMVWENQKIYYFGYFKSSDGVWYLSLGHEFKSEGVETVKASEFHTKYEEMEDPQ